MATIQKEEIVKARQKQKCDTTENWAKASNFVPLKGEIIFYQDNQPEDLRWKVGDGTTKLSELPFVAGGGRDFDGETFAVGVDTRAGIKGFYWTEYKSNNIDNKYIYYFKIKSVPYGVDGTYITATELLKYYQIGDVLTIHAQFKFNKKCTIVSITQGVAGQEESQDYILAVESSEELSPFQNKYGADMKQSDNAVFCPEKQDNGIVEFGLGAFASGKETRAINLGATALGEDTEAYGQFSLAIGQETQAGHSAFASGRRTEATGEYSHAEGLDSLASGNYSHVEGQENEAQGDASHAEGWKTVAEGAASHTEGRGTKALHVGSHAEGLETMARGNGSHAEGQNTTTLSDAAHIEGGSTNQALEKIATDATDEDILTAWDSSNSKFALAKGQFSHVEGVDSLALGKASHAGGRNTKATGVYSHSEGWSTTASGTSAHSEGTGTIASNENTHAEGSYTEAAGAASHAEGEDTHATNAYAHAEGKGTYAAGWTAHAEGNNTQAIKHYSHAGGLGTITSAEAQTAIGKYNVERTDALLVVGNGENSSSRKNALEVKLDGTVSVGAEPKSDNDVVTKAYLEKMLDELFAQITPFSFTSWPSTSASYAYGENSEEQNINIDFALNREAISIIPAAESGDSKLTYKYQWKYTPENKAGTNNLKTYTLTVTATDKYGNTVSKSVTHTYTHYIFWGVAGEKLESLNNLNRELRTKNIGKITGTPGQEEYLWYCCPELYGKPIFREGVFEGGFDQKDSLVYKYGDKEISYYCYRTTNANLGKLEFDVT